MGEMAGESGKEIKKPPEVTGMTPKQLRSGPKFMSVRRPTVAAGEELTKAKKTKKNKSKTGRRIKGKEKDLSDFDLRHKVKQLIL